MRHIGLCLACVGIVFGPVSILPAADRPSPGSEPQVGLFDTLRPLAAPISSGSLEGKQGWQLLVEEKLDHPFQGDAVLWNRRMAAVLRRGSPGAEVYSRGPNGWQRQALLIPAAADAARELLSVKTVANDGAAVAVEASFRAGDGQMLGLVCQLTPEAAFVRTEPRGATKRLQIHTAGRFGVIPDFYADDITLDAARIPLAKVRVPSENMLGHLLKDGASLAVALWDGAPQEVEMTLTGSGEERTFTSAEIQFAKQGKIYLGMFVSAGDCYVGLLRGLPDRTDPIAGFKLPSPVKRLAWKMPFPAQWRVDFVTASDNPKLLRSREMSAPFPWPVKDGKCQGFRFIKPSFAWDWGGGTHTELSGAPDKYPSWIDFDGWGFVRPIAESYAVIVYPFDRGRGTPLEAITLTDLVRQTLGVGPCQYILDADRRMAQTPGIFTCGGTDMLKKMEGRMSQRKAEAEKLLDGMVVFMKAYRRRIEQYIAFRRELMGYLETQEKQHPDQQPFIRQLRSRVEGIPAQMTQDYPAVVEKLAAEYRTTLDSDDEPAKKKRAALHPRFPAAGGAQDNILQGCHQVVRLLRYQAGMAPAADPVTAEIALEVRRRASAVLQNPMYHETKDRHRPDGK